MRINTNISALNAHRQLGITQNAVSSSMQKLSSGFRINRAADDAAGLGIANQLRSTTRSMTQASRNAEQANSLLQIAEGATSGVQNMLERMKELATQAGSDTVDDAGRTRINEEFKALREEITRTVDTTKFQGKTLLNGTFGEKLSGELTTGSLLQEGDSVLSGQVTSTVKAGSIDASQLAAGDYQFTVSGSTITLAQGTTTIGTATISTASIAEGANADIALDFQNADGTSVFKTTVNVAIASTADSVDQSLTTSDAITSHVHGVLNQDTTGTADMTVERVDQNQNGKFLVSSSGDYAGQDSIQMKSIDLTTTSLGLDSLSLATADGAKTSLTALDSAIETVNSQLGNIGAFQNRIENSQANLKTAIQNFSAAESVIRDVDMAEEMVRFSKNNILSQAGTSMLAQANQSSQGVLSLLR